MKKPKVPKKHKLPELWIFHDWDELVVAYPDGGIHFWSISGRCWEVGFVPRKRMVRNQANGHWTFLGEIK